jgi:hypothetical protein
MLVALLSLIWPEIAWILGALGVLGLVNIVVYSLKNYFIFRPSKVIPMSISDLPDGTEEITINVNRTLVSCDTTNILYFPKKDCDNLLIFSHGTSGNMWHRVKYVKDIMNTLNTSVVLYDYRGYGKSEGYSSEENMCYDIETVYNHINQTYHPKNVILYGASLGTVPTIHLAYKINCKTIILHSPFVSLRQVIPWYIRHFIYFAIKDFDMAKKIKRIHNPLLLLHSVDDNVIPYWHSKYIMEKLTYRLTQYRTTKMLIPLTGKHGAVKITSLLPHIKQFLSIV